MMINIGTKIKMNRIEKYPIGTRIRLIKNDVNKLYFHQHFHNIDENGIFSVTGYHHNARTCIYLDCKPDKAISYERFEIISSVNLPEELFTL